LVKKQKMKKIIYSILLLTAGLSSCTKDQLNRPADSTSDEQLIKLISEDNQNPDDLILNETITRNNSNDFVYTMTNGAGTNTILIYRQNPNGSLSAMGSVPSGGNGAGVSLDSQGALAIDKDHNLLFAVNAGSNSVSSFRIGTNGSLQLVSTASSGGVMPVSLTIYDQWLYVVNATSANISGLTFDHSGMLSALGNSSQPLSSTTAAPAQISFSPEGNFLYVTEKMTNMIDVYPVNSDGIAQPGVYRPSVGMTPFGFDFARDQYMIVSNAHGGMMNASTATSYLGINNGDPTAVNGEVPDHQTAACWVATTYYGRYAYITNTGSNTISSYYIGADGTLYLISSVAAMTDQHPIDLCIDENRFVHNLNTMSNTITSFRRNMQGRLHRIGSVAGIPSTAAGIACY
jgi:6-phosphogluconolactonase